MQREVIRLDFVKRERSTGNDFNKFRSGVLDILATLESSVRYQGPILVELMQRSEPTASGMMVTC